MNDRRRAHATRELLGWRFAALSEQQCVEHIVRELGAGRGGWVVTANSDHLRRLVRDQAFAKLCRQASLLVADGMPLVWASRAQGTPLPERVAGSSLICTLSAAAADQGCSVFLLGGEAGTAEQAAEVLGSRYPGLRIAGTCCPWIGQSPTRDERDIRAVSGTLTRTQPDIVFVALGSPKQEFVIDRLRGVLPRAWWLGVGISFSYLSGRVRRPPAWMRQAGLEWLGRLVQEPRRLRARYLRDDLPFCISLLLQAAALGVRRARFRAAGTQR